MSDLHLAATAKRRSLFLKAAAFFVSLWLLAFGLDGLLSLSDELLTLLDIHALTNIRNIVALLVVLLLSPLVLLLLVFVPHLPKRIFLLPVIFTFWANLYPWPFTGTETIKHLGLALALAQLALFIGAFIQVRLISGRAYLRAMDLPIRTHLIRRTLIIGALGCLVILLCLPFVAGFLLATTVEQQTGGYLRFTSHGVEAQQVELTKGDRHVRLIGMIHLGKAQFYNEVFNTIPAEAIVLLEGVTDKDKRFTSTLTYDKAASVLGLDNQAAIQMAWMQQQIETESTSSTQPAPMPKIMLADVDASDFSGKTISFISEVGTVYGAASIWQAMERLRDMSAHYTDVEVKAVYAELVDKRDAHLIAQFDKLPDDQKLVVIPWGAQHMPGIQKALLERGYAISSRKTLSVAAYSDLF